MRKFSLIIGVTTTASLICAALIGMEVARVLPAGHLTSDVRDAASLPISIIGTLAALVLGLMVSTAKDARAERGRQIAQISVNWVRLNRIFLSGIFPAHSARAAPGARAVAIQAGVSRAWRAEAQQRRGVELV